MTSQRDEGGWGLVELAVQGDLSLEILRPLKANGSWLLMFESPRFNAELPIRGPEVLRDLRSLLTTREQGGEVRFANEVAVLRRDHEFIDRFFLDIPAGGSAGVAITISGGILASLVSLLNEVQRSTGS